MTGVLFYMFIKIDDHVFSIATGETSRDDNLGSAWSFEVEARPFKEKW